MFTSLDFFGAGDTRVAAFDWTDLSALNSANCAGCGGIQFGGTLLSGVEFYQNEGFGPYLGKQKTGPIPLGDECGTAGLSTDTSCPEGNIATNGDGMTQVSQAGGNLWGAVSHSGQSAVRSQQRDASGRRLLGGEHVQLRQDRLVQPLEPGVRIGGPRRSGDACDRRRRNETTAVLRS